MKKIKSKDIITKRNTINSEIIKYWKIIRQENIISKSAVKAGMGSGYDLKQLYNLITQLSENRIRTKLYLQALNMGLTGVDLVSTLNGSNYENIYRLNEKKEILVQLGLIKTLNPEYKSRMGKKISMTETFTKQKLDIMKKELQLEINALEKTIETFNDNTEISITNIKDATIFM